MATSPTQRTLAAWRDMGATVQVVEKWNPHAKVRQDLFGCIDVVACSPIDVLGGREMDRGRWLWSSAIIGIQSCAGASVSARLKKARAEPRLRTWLQCGGLFVVEGWAKKGPRGKRKTWQLRRVWVTLDDLDSEWDS